MNTIQRHEINLLTRKLAELSGWDFSENYDLFTAKDPRAKGFLTLAITAYEFCHEITIEPKGDNHDS